MFLWSFFLGNAKCRQSVSNKYGRHICIHSRILRIFVKKIKVQRIIYSKKETHIVSIWWCSEPSLYYPISFLRFWLYIRKNSFVESLLSINLQYIICVAYTYNLFQSIKIYIILLGSLNKNIWKIRKFSGNF